MSPSEFAVQPLVSSEALQDLQTTVPVEFGTEVSTATQPSYPIPARRIAAGRIWQVAKTSLPLIAADLLALAAAFLLATACASVMTSHPVPVGLAKHLLGLSVVYAAAAMFLGLYPASSMNPVFELRQQVLAFLAASVLLVTLNGIVGVVASMEIATLLVCVPMAVVAMPISRFTMRRICSGFDWWGERVVIVGAGPQGRAVHRFLSNLPHRGLRAVGIVDDDASRYWNDPNSARELDYLGTIDGVMEICRREDAHWIIAAIADRSQEEITSILNRCSLAPNLIVLSSPLMLPSLWVRSCDCVGLSGVHIQDRLLLPLHGLVKRVFDITVSGFLLALFSPILAVSALMIRRKSPGPMFFGQERIGRGGSRFTVWKIRSMILNGDQILEEYLEKHPVERLRREKYCKLDNDPRVIPGIGAFLRKTSLDEIPQLWNVLIGDMSLVGPRPCLEEEIPRYEEAYPLYIKMRPGITGLWQVSGRNHTTFSVRVHLDKYYVRNWSLWLDYYILLRTVRTVLRREGSF